MKLHTKQLTLAALTAAAYAVLSYFGSIFGITYGPIQCRFSEALCVLPFFLPETAWGLGVGCLIANLLSPYGVLDIVVGSAATLLAVTSVSANSILFSSRGQIKGLTTSAGLVSCCILGFATGAGLYTLTLIVYVFLLCILAGFPAFEAYLKNRSNHFEVHMELKSSFYLRDFVTVSRRLGLRIDDIEANQAYAGSGLSVYSVSLTICSQELKKYKTHVEIIEALSSLDYIYHIEEMH